MNKNMSIQKKINLALIFVLILGFFVTGILTIFQVKSSITKEISKQLDAQTNSIFAFISETDKANKTLEKSLIEDAEKELRTKIILINNSIKSLIYAYDLADLEDTYIIQELLKKIRLTTFKDEGTFIFVIDSKGNIIEHPDKSLIGKNINNNNYIQKIIKMKKGQVVYSENNINKYAVFRYNADFQWYFILTTPKSVILENSNNLEKELIGGIKNNIKNIKIGDTGYYYIMDSKGTLLVHPSLTGQNISKYPFIQEIMKNKNGFIKYKWDNKDKIVSYKYYKDRDWIIAGGSYLDEFVGPTMNSIITQLAITSILAIIAVILIFTFIFIANVIKPLGLLEKLFSRISDGDLTAHIDNDKDNEISRIINHADNMVGKINNSISKVNDSTKEVTTSAQTLTNASNNMANGSDSQAQQVSQVEVAMHQMTATIQEISMNVEEVNAEVVQIKDSASTGGEVLEETVTCIDSLSGSVMNTAENIKQLGASSEEIGNILQVISDIADQTNLLALNAAIEAARAGENGRGFAVVADEVRKLAERTVNATSEIDSMINNIQKEVLLSISGMDKGVQLAEESGMMVANLRVSLEEIINGVGDIADKITAIATAVEEQSATSQEISSSMADIAAVAQESSSIASENNVESEKLMQLASDLTTVVNQFRLK